jgi:7-cyano-7-deazaguanine synthase
MCSIFGAIGPRINRDLLGRIQQRAQDRGRDGGRVEWYQDNELEACLGNWRATPTPEIEVGPLQPYNRLVHNGTIANDVALGAEPGEIDSMALSRYVHREDVYTLSKSLKDVQGSYALACYNGHTILTATNYKPLHYAKLDGVVYFSSMARHFKDVLPFGHAPVAVTPYSAVDLVTGQVAGLKQIARARAVVIASSGLDSTVVATQLVRQGHDVCLLHFTYGCVAETREHEAIVRIAHDLDCDYAFLTVDLATMLGLRSSRLFNKDAGAVISGPVEGAEYAHEWVPGRNLVFVSLAVAWAEAHGYHTVALGNNLEEAGAYPDNEEQFTTLLNDAVPYAVQAHYGMQIVSPVGHLMKKEIVQLGLTLDAPFQHTWSCYRGGAVHCGQCGPCFMRMKAFERNGAVDPVFQAVQS